MKLKVNRIDVWTAAIDDRPGGSADRLEALAKAGANLEFLLARRSNDQPGKGILFVAPIKGARVVKGAQEAGFDKSPMLQSLRIEGSDVPGLGGRIARALATAGISFRGLSAVALGRKFVAYLALDSADDAARAQAVLKKLS